MTGIVVPCRHWDWKTNPASPLRWRKPYITRLKGELFDGMPTETQDRVFAVMALRPDVAFWIQTEFPDRMQKYLDGMGKETEDYSDRWDAARRWLRSQLTSPKDRKSMGRWEYVGVMMAYQRWPLPNVHLEEFSARPD